MWYERYLSKWKEIVAMPWVVCSCGAWMGLAFLRGQHIRYEQWRIRHLEAERDHAQRMTRDLERRIARLERRIARDE
jgi:hypothetical protein